MRREASVESKLASGIAAGMVGTVVIASLMKASERWAPAMMPPLRRDPGEFMTSTAEKALPRNVRNKVDPRAEKAAAGALHLGYGVTCGALYALLVPRHRSGPLMGTLFGALVWAVGYLGWLPGLRLMPPITAQRPAQVIGPLLEHLAYGISTSQVCDLLRGR